MTLERSSFPVELATIDEIGKRYRNGDLDPVEVVRLVLSRIEQQDPRINSFITVASEAVL